MATTYITLVNDLLRRINEVQLTTTGDGFSTVKNVQAIAKDAINNLSLIHISEPTRPY